MDIGDKKAALSSCQIKYQLPPLLFSQKSTSGNHMQPKVVLFLAVFITFSLCCFNGNAASLPANASRQLTFLGTADLQGQLEPALSSIDLDGSGRKIKVAGGISRIAAIIKKIKTDNDQPVIVLTSGDDLMGRYFNTFQGKAITSLLSVAGYDIFALGNHEFDHGPGLLGETLAQTDIITLCSDLDIKNTALESTCLESFIKEYDDVRIGYFSLMTPEFASVTNGGNVSLKGSTLQIGEAMVRSLKLKGVDIVVAVTHLGIDLDRKLAAEVDGIDVIFGGHSHDYLHQLESINNTLIVNGGEKGTALVRLDVFLDKDTLLLTDSARYSLIPVRESVPEDPITAKRLKYFTDKLPKTVVLGRTDKEWHLDKKSLRSGESSVADMINDLILKKFQVDLVLNNSGAFRGNKMYPAGPVTDTMLHEIDAFENDIYLLKIKGQYLREILEHSAASLGHGGFLQIGGGKIKIDTTANRQEIAQKDGQWQVTRPGQQIMTVQIRNNDGSYSPMDLEKEYSVATNAFLAKNGGDNYYWFNKYGLEQINTYTTLYSIMSMEIHHEKTLTPSALDGRILLVTEEHP
jgi:5'-nucleotidase / UDP-sugar diphosphatase